MQRNEEQPGLAAKSRSKAEASQAPPKTNTESECQLTSADSKVQTTENKESPRAPSTSLDLQESQSEGAVANTPKQTKLKSEVEKKKLS